MAPGEYDGEENQASRGHSSEGNTLYGENNSGD